MFRSWHSLMEIIGGVRKRFLNASSSANMIGPRLPDRQKFLPSSMGVKRLSPLTTNLPRSWRMWSLYLNPPENAIVLSYEKVGTG